VLRNDNEENVVLALKILLELYRDFKNILEDHVQSFLDFVKDLYRNMPYAVDVAFNADKAASMAILVFIE
jgi:transformation/transcription domain-associated protein